VITEFFLFLMRSIAELVLSLFPDGPDPDELDGTVTSGLGTLFGYAGGFGSWVPWSTIGGALLLVVACLVAAGVIKLVRIVASFLTLGGGSAA